MLEDVALLNTLKLLKSEKYADKTKGARDLEQNLRKLPPNEDATIKEIIRILSEHGQPNHRIGGLLGLSSTIFALEHNILPFLHLIIPFIVSSFDSDDNKVRSCACETLKYLIGTAGLQIVPYFVPIFECLYKASNDPDSTVVSSFVVIDRTLKDIILSSGYTSMEIFVDKIKLYMYSINPSTSLFLISWLNLFNDIPNLHLIDFLPDLLDGIFTFLEFREVEIMLQTTKLLADLLTRIESRDRTFDFHACAKIVVAGMSSGKQNVKDVAISWLYTFLRISPKDQLIGLSSHVYESIIYCIVPESNSPNVVQKALFCFDLFVDLVASEGDELDEDCLAQPPSDHLMTVMISFLESPIFQVRSTTLKTLISLIKHIPRRIIHNYKSIFTVSFVIFESILPSADTPEFNSVSLCFDLIYLITTTTAFSKCPSVPDFSDKIWWTELLNRSINPFHIIFTSRLVQWFKLRNEDHEMSAVTIELAKRTDPSQLMVSLALILSHDLDHKFIANSVNVLNLVMMTSPVFHHLRSSLTSPSNSMFESLYKTWSYSPISVVTLCLLAKYYEHALFLVECIPLIGLDLDLLVDIDKLVKLLELPVFAYLRIDLVNTSINGSLFKCLYSLLMLMPQTESFKALYRRLKCVPSFMISPASGDSHTDSEHLKRHFLTVHKLT